MNSPSPANEMSSTDSMNESSSSTSQPIAPVAHSSHNVRTQVRQQIRSILVRRLRIPSPSDGGNTALLRRQRILVLKQLTIRIECSLYRRSLNMEWYADLRMLEWRVVQIAREMLAKRSKKSEKGLQLLESSWRLGPQDF